MLRANEFAFKVDRFLLRADNGLTGLFGATIIKAR
jgi:hypothetical protein